MLSFKKRSAFKFFSLLTKSLVQHYFITFSNISLLLGTKMVSLVGGYLLRLRYLERTCKLDALSVIPVISFLSLLGDCPILSRLLCQALSFIQVLSQSSLTIIVINLCCCKLSFTVIITLIVVLLFIVLLQLCSCISLVPLHNCRGEL